MRVVRPLRVFGFFISVDGSCSPRHGGCKIILIGVDKEFVHSSRVVPVPWYVPRTAVPEIFPFVLVVYSVVSLNDSVLRQATLVTVFAS